MGFGRRLPTFSSVGAPEASEAAGGDIASGGGDATSATGGDDGSSLFSGGGFFSSCDTVLYTRALKDQISA